MLRQQAASGKPVATFCTDRGVSLSSYYRWKRRLAERPAGKQPGRFAPVVVVGGGRPAGPLTIETPRGYRVVVPPGFDEASLERVLSVLRRGEAQCC